MLKFAGIIRSGALAKEFLITNEVYVNGEKEDRRGRKLYKGYIIFINNQEIEVK